MLRELPYVGKDLTWRSSKVTCQYPEHRGDKKRARERAGVTLKMAQDIWKLFKVVVPIGSGSFVIIFINTVLIFVFSLIDEC